MNGILIIGGGFFGAHLAQQFARAGHRVQLIEREGTLMSRASYANQGRIHQGYHYPRSILTALRSRMSFPRFVDEFRDCIDSDFAMHYLIGTPLGRVSARQFQKFCERIGAPCEPSPYSIQRLTNPALIEASFSTVEYAFDAIKLRNVMTARLEDAGVVCRFGVSAEAVREHGTGLIVDVTDVATGYREEIHADHVFNCTYSGINRLLANSSVELIPLKHELTEMCLVEVPDELRKIGVTVMCGPFFSTMPFPPAGLHSFSHVRYTPHVSWSDESAGGNDSVVRRDGANSPASAWRHMQKDSARFIPILSECVYHRSLWEVKTVLPRSEADDSRPILFSPNHGLRGLHCVMGGKIDNVYDIGAAIESHGLLDCQR